MQETKAPSMEQATGPDDAGHPGQAAGRPSLTVLDRPNVPGKLLLAFGLLCVLGVAVSAELARIHVFVHTDPSYHSVCAMSEGVNCETVALSPYAVFLGLPVAVWGIVGYLAMGVLSLSGIRRWRLHPAWPWGLLLALAAFSVLASAILAYISATQIASLCVFCICSYAINAGLLLVAVLAARRSGARLFALPMLDGHALLRRPLLAVSAGFASAAILLGLELLVPHYWRTPGWKDLPQLASGLDSEGHHWIGAEHPALTIVEFSDYECPHCRRAHKDVRLLAAQHPARIRLVHRHLPLDRACHPGLRMPFHEHACRFAEAAECAGAQGRFWEMNDALFSTQDKVKAKNLDPMELAVRIGLHRAQFRRCLDEHATAPRIADDVQESMARRLNGTPSFVVGDEVFVGRIPEAALARLLPGAP